MNMKKFFMLSCGLALLSISTLTACSDDSPELPSGNDNNGGTPEETLPEISTPETPSLSDLSQKELSILDRQNEIGLILLNEDLTRSNDNITLSPLTFNLAISIIANGADGAALSAFEKAYSANVDDVNALNSRLLNALPSADSYSSLSLATSMWTGQAVTLRQEFIERISTSYSSPYKGVANTNSVNEWIASTTGNNIRNLFENIGDDVQFMSVSTVDFSAKWRNGMEFTDVREADFHNADGSTSKAKMLNDKYFIPFATGDSYSAVSLSLGSRYELLCILPDEGKSVSDVLSNLSGSNLRELRCTNNYQTEVELSLPKFEVNYDWSIPSVIPESTGLAPMFAKNADYGRLIAESGVAKLGDSFLQAKSRTKFRVDETGVHGSSASAVYSAVNAPLPDKQKELRMNFNRPFIFAIRENGSGALIFIGAINKL